LAMIFPIAVIVACLHATILMGLLLNTTVIPIPCLAATAHGLRGFSIASSKVSLREGL
jgi:hypothetical protein